MAMNENSPDPAGSAVNRNTQPRLFMHPLHEAAMRLADLGAEIGRSRSKAKTRDLVGMLLSHGARAWRSSQPAARIHLHAASGPGRSAIYLRLR